MWHAIYVTHPDEEAKGPKNSSNLWNYIDSYSLLTIDKDIDLIKR